MENDYAKLRSTPKRKRLKICDKITLPLKIIKKIYSLSF